MSYEKGDKFVLEIAESFESGEKKLYRMKNFASLVFDENGLQRLRRIRETSEEAYMRGYLDGKNVTERKIVEHHVAEPDEEQLAKARAEGAEEAWEFRNKTIYKTIYGQSSKEFEWYKQSTKACYEMTYAEAKAAFEAWKKRRQWEPMVGDVVTVVRCKYCKHYQFAPERAFGLPVKRCEVTGFEDVEDNDFCSRGARRDGE